MPARVIEVADAVAASLAAAAPGVAVVRAYEQDLPEGGPADLTVYVLPRQYGQAGIGSRGADRAGYGVAVVAARRFDPPVPAADVDALVLWCQEHVYDPLSDPRRMPVLPPPCDGLWPQEAEVEMVYDPDELRRGLFVSVMTFDFHGIE